MDDRYWMERALQEARLALEENEVPVGAVLVKDDILVAADHNRTRQLSNPLAHAEKLCIEKVLAQGESHLYQYTLYVTLEPCVMCAGAIIWSRVGRVVFGASDDKAGATGSIYNVLLDKSFNHHPQLRSGIIARECGAILSEFFAARRQSRS